MKKIFYIFTVAAALFFTGCKDKVMGYSVLLWNAPEYELASGQVVPVYIRSNISHVYVIGLSNGQKIEIPLWQMTEPVKKSRIAAVKNRYAECASTYATVKLDGLPCRAEAVNTSKQVYRLRKGEIIKLLYKGNGQAPMAGKKPLEGDWYKILTNNGTQGWCFSYNLSLFQTDEKGQIAGGQIMEEEVQEDTAYDTITANTWYPDSFKTMIESGNIDLTKLHPSYNFKIDTENNKVTLNTYTIHQSWNYEGYTKTEDNEYTLKNIPVVLIYKNSHFIVARYTGESGKPEELNFVTITQDLNEIISAEKSRRAQAYSAIYSSGPVFKSSNYGTITFEQDGTFKWSNFRLLVPGIIDAGAKNYGTVSIKKGIAKALAGSYDGVVTFKFEGMQTEVNFLYKIEDGSLRLEDATAAEFKGNLVTARGSSPLILFFKKV